MTEAIVASKGKELQDNISKLIKDAQDVERRLLVTRISSSEQEAADFKMIFIGLLGVIAIVLIVVYIIIRLNLRALRLAQNESNRKNWTLSGSGELVKGMQGNKLTTELSQKHHYSPRSLCKWVDWCHLSCRARWTSPSICCVYWYHQGRTTIIYTF